MKVSRIGFVALLLSASLLFPNENPGLHSLVQANAVRESKTGLPSFLEQSKTYNFSFALSMGDDNSSATPPIVITGKVEKLNAEAGRVYINHYVGARKGKVYQYKFQGSIEIKKMIFRIESQRDGQTLAPDAIWGMSRKIAQAPAGRPKSSFQCEHLSPRWGWRFFAGTTPRSRTGLISGRPAGTLFGILFLNIYI